MRINLLGQFMNSLVFLCYLETSFTTRYEVISNNIKSIFHLQSPIVLGLSSPNQGVDLYEKTNKLEETLNQFIEISMLNYRSIESSIKNLEIQMGQLAKQITERPTNSFGANTEKNPKEECKVFFTRRESTKKKKIIEKDVHDEEGEKDKSKKSGDEVSTTKTKSQLARETIREIPPASSKETLYPLVSSKKDKEHYFKQFLDILEAGDYYPFWRGHTADAIIQKVLKVHPHKKGKVHQQRKHYGERKLQCSNPEATS